MQAAEPSVKLLGRYFVVATTDRGDRKATQRLMEAWYRDHAKVLLSARVEYLMARTTWLDIEFPPMQVRVLRDRWGSASPSGRISFNLDLVKLPLRFTDYVVAHELVHLRSPAIRARTGGCSNA